MLDAKVPALVWCMLAEGSAISESSSVLQAGVGIAAAVLIANFGLAAFKTIRDMRNGRSVGNMAPGMSPICQRNGEALARLDERMKAIEAKLGRICNQEKRP